MFAGDLKFYNVIDIANCAVSSSDFQQSIDNVLQWATLWQFTVSAGKTFVLTFKNDASSVSSQPYSVDYVHLSQSNLVSHLGITMYRRLLLKQHINNIVSKSMQRSGILFLGFLSRDLSLKQAHSLHTLGQSWNIVLVPGAQLIRCKLT
jgi:hypothetical protein